MFTIHYNDPDGVARIMEADSVSARPGHVFARVGMDVHDLAAYGNVAVKNAHGHEVAHYYIAPPGPTIEERFIPPAPTTTAHCEFPKPPDSRIDERRFIPKPPRDDSILENYNARGATD